MSIASPTLRFFRREGCTLCDEARQSLQAVLEERARRGEPIPRVREVDVASSKDLEAAYGARIPVIALDEHELSLTPSARAIRVFLDRHLPQLA